MRYQALARTERPHRFEEVVAQTQTVQALTNALDQNRIHHAYLLTGTHGVGKTSILRILAKCLSCERGISANPCDQCNHCQEIDAGCFPDLYEVDAASRTRIEETRELLDNVPYAPIKGRFKIYLIDEVHMLSTHSFNALLKTLEEPPAHVKFLFATTEHQKLPATVLSRCLQFYLRPMNPAQISAHLNAILDKEKISYEPQATDILAHAANGSMRDALSILDQSISYANGHLTSNAVKSMLGLVETTELLKILNALQEKNGNQMLECVQILAEKGADFQTALDELLSLLHQISIIQLVPDFNSQTNEELSSLARLFTPEDIQLFYQMGITGQQDLAYAPSKRVGFEMILLRMLAFYPETDTSRSTAIISTSTTTDNTTVIHADKAINNWPDLLAQLSLSGAALVLARNCDLKEMTTTHIYLSLDSKHKPLLQEKQIQRIHLALKEVLKRDIKVHISLAESQETKPLKKQNEFEQSKTTDQSVLNDPNVQHIMQTFNATMEK